MSICFPGVTSGKEPTYQCRRYKRYEFDPWVRKIPGGGHGNPLQYSCLENPMDKELGGLQFTGSQRVGHDWATKHACRVNMETTQMPSEHRNLEEGDTHVIEGWGGFMELKGRKERHRVPADFRDTIPLHPRNSWSSSSYFSDEETADQTSWGPGRRWSRLWGAGWWFEPRVTDSTSSGLPFPSVTLIQLDLPGQGAFWQVLFKNRVVVVGGNVPDRANSMGDRTWRWEPFELGVCAGRVCVRKETRRSNGSLTYTPSKNTWRAAVAAAVVAREPLHILDDGFCQVLQAALPCALLPPEGHGERLLFAVRQHRDPPAIRNRRKET